MRRRPASSWYRRLLLLAGLALAVGLFAGACGGDGEEAAPPAPAAETAPATKPAPAPPPTKAEKGGVYVGKTSEGKPVRVKVSASGTTGRFSIEPKSSTCTGFEAFGQVRISKAGQILAQGKVLGAFVSRRLAKGTQRGLPPWAKGVPCRVAETVTWQARLR